MGVTGRKQVGTRAGSVLPLVVMIIVILALVGWGMLTLGMNARVFAAKQSDELVATSAADAGIAKVLSIMNEEVFNNGPGSQASPIPLTSENLEACDATVEYSAGTYQTGEPGYEWGYHLATSTGRCRLGKRTINTILYYKSLWFGIGVEETADIMPFAEFSAAPDSDFSIRTNSTEDGAINIKSGAVIPGDVICGPGSDPEDAIDIKPNVFIEGTCYAAPDLIDFPPVELPPLVLAAPLSAPVPSPGDPNVLIVGDATVLDTQYFRFSTINLGEGQSLRIEGNCVIYVEGTGTGTNTAISIGNAAEMVVTNGSSMSLYLGGDLVEHNSSGISNENALGLPEDDWDARREAAARLKIYGCENCETIEIKAKAETFLGYTYAPDADIRIKNSAQVSGAFTGKSFQSYNSSEFVYLPPPGNMVELPAYLAVRWWEE